MAEHYDAIVIGAGVGGLVAGGLLARAGYRVLILERHAVVGGCCSTFRREHFVFDAAVHTIGGCASGDVIASTLKELGVNDELRFVSLTPFYAVRVGDETVYVPANLDEMRSSLTELVPEERDSLNAFIENVKVIGSLLLDLSNGDCYSIHQMELLDQVRYQNWSQFLASHFHSQRLLTVFGALCFYAGLEPERVSAAFMASLFYSYHRGAYYPIGSTQRFVDVLANAIRMRGGSIQRRATVCKILTDEHGVTGIQYITRKNEQNEVFAPVIVSNADASKTLLDWVGRERLPAAFLRKFRQLERSTSAICLYLAVSAGEWEVPSHETFYLPSWQPAAQQFYYLPGSGGTEGPAPILSICVPTQSDPGLAPAGHHVVSVTALVDVKTVEALREEKGKQFIEQDLLCLVEKLVPGITRCIRYKELATPRTIERYTNNLDGAMYGWAKSAEQWPTKVGPKTSVPGLYLAGHWAQGGHGISGAFSAGIRAARKILEADIKISKFGEETGILPEQENRFGNIQYPPSPSSAAL